MGATENECLIFGFLSEEEPKKVEEALMDPDWVIAKQDELSRIERQIPLKLIPRTKDKTANWHLMGIQKEAGWRWLCYEGQGHTGCRRLLSSRSIEYEIYALEARLEAIRVFWHSLSIRSLRFIKWMWSVPAWMVSWQKRFYVQPSPDFGSLNLMDFVYLLFKALNRLE